MANKYCCPNCFGDYELEKNIFPSLDAKTGVCSFCKSIDVKVLEPSLLINSFQPLVEIYKQRSDGKPLIELLKKDWFLFENPNLDLASSINLLDEIFQEAGLSNQKFVLSNTYQSNGLERWEAFKAEIMHNNRWFLDKAIDLVQLESLLSSLHAIDLPDTWYRARLLKHSEMFGINEMGAPPKLLSTFGRANPAGIPYLYLASNPETALAEVRPQNKENAAIASFLVNDIKVVDLRNPRKRISPFLLQEAEKIGALSAELPFLEHLGSELTRPVLHFDAAINYTPSQYLCEFIKKKNYDGVVYNSSVNNGFNLALFDPGIAKATFVNKHVADVKVEFS